MTYPQGQAPYGWQQPAPHGPASFPHGPASFPGGPASFPGGPAPFPGGPAPSRGNRLATASLASGVATLLLCGCGMAFRWSRPWVWQFFGPSSRVLLYLLIFLRVGVALAAVVCGVAALVRRTSAKGQAVAGMLFGGAYLLFYIPLLIFSWVGNLGYLWWLL